MNEIVVAFKDNGKSTLALWLAQQKRKPIIAYSPHEVFSDYVETLDSSERIDNIEDLDEALDGKLTAKTFIEYVPEGENDETDFDEFVAKLWKPKNCVILLDEASYVQTSGHAPRYLKKLLRLNEKRYNVDLIQASHRITDISTLSRSQSWDWYIGYTADKRDLDIIREKWGDDVAAAVAAIPFHSFQFVHVSATMRSFELWDDPTKWYQPLIPKQQ